MLQLIKRGFASLLKKLAQKVSGGMPEGISDVVTNPSEISWAWYLYRAQMDKRGLKALSHHNFVRHFSIYSNLYRTGWGWIGGEVRGGVLVPSHVVIKNQKGFLAWLKSSSQVAFLVPEDLGSMLKRTGFKALPFSIKIEWNGHIVSKKLYLKPALRVLVGLALFLSEEGISQKDNWEAFNQWADIFYPSADESQWEIEDWRAIRAEKSAEYALQKKVEAKYLVPADEDELPENPEYSYQKLETEEKWGCYA